MSTVGIIKICYLFENWFHVNCIYQDMRQISLMFCWCGFCSVSYVYLIDEYQGQCDK